MASWSIEDSSTVIYNDISYKVYWDKDKNQYYNSTGTTTVPESESLRMVRHGAALQSDYNIIYLLQEWNRATTSDEWVAGNVNEEHPYSQSETDTSSFIKAITIDGGEAITTSNGTVNLDLASKYIQGTLSDDKYILAKAIYYSEIADNNKFATIQDVIDNSSGGKIASITINGGEPLTIDENKNVNIDIPSTITVSATDGVTDGTNTYKYTPTAGTVVDSTYSHITVSAADGVSDSSGNTYKYSPTAGTVVDSNYSHITVDKDNGVSDNNGNTYKYSPESGTVVDNNYSHITVTSSSVKDAAGNTFTGIVYDDDEIQGAVEAIQKLIPSEATESNQLADKNFVNSSISTATATFKGTVDSVDKLSTITADLNDYAFVTSVDSTNKNTIYTRYKYDGSKWVEEYVVNNSGFTAAQWATINSGVTKDTTYSSLSAAQNGTDVSLVTTGEKYDWNNKLDGITKDMVTTALGYTPPTQDTTYSSKTAADGGTDVSLVTTGEKYTWNNKSDFSGSYDDLTNKPTIPTVPSTVSSFTNDSHYNYSTVISEGDIDALAAATSGKVGINGSIYLKKKDSGTGSDIPAGWYNYIFAPHRYGYDSDNASYGNIILMPMTFSGDTWVLRRSNSTTTITEAKKLLTSVPTNILTTAPTAANTSGVMQFVVLSSEPSTKYSGYMYIIKES